MACADPDLEMLFRLNLDVRLFASALTTLVQHAQELPLLTALTVLKTLIRHSKFSYVAVSQSLGNALQVDCFAFTYSMTMM